MTVTSDYYQPPCLDWGTGQTFKSLIILMKFHCFTIELYFNFSFKKLLKYTLD